MVRQAAEFESPVDSNISPKVVAAVILKELNMLSASAKHISYFRYKKGPYDTGLHNQKIAHTRPRHAF
jgi:hypothetical protein